jgi:plasmid stabilization system protein ParE
MEYAVKLTQRAGRDLDLLSEYISTSNSAVARRWFNKLERAIYGLRRAPRRCLCAPESIRTGRQLRHLLYSSKPNVYRVLYEVHDATKTVLVLAIRHGARAEWNPKKSA